MKYYRYVDVYVYNVYIIYTYKSFFLCLPYTQFIQNNPSKPAHFVGPPEFFSALELVHHVPAFQKIFGFELDFGASFGFFTQVWNSGRLHTYLQVRGTKAPEIGVFSKLFSSKGCCILDSWVLLNYAY